MRLTKRNTYADWKKNLQKVNQTTLFYRPFFHINSGAAINCSQSIIVGSLISIALFLPMPLLYTGAAPVTKFLFIAGRTDASFTGIPVISRRAGKRKSILRSFRTHKDHAPFFYIIDPSKKRFNINNQKIQRNTW